jgi:aryl-alcohol dehydrogenase-like predicted oxidoreductase
MEASDMKYTYLGRSGMKVSRLCLGTMNFGRVTKEKDAHYIMDAALDLGINFFDTANVYGFTPRGLTEEIIGRWFAKGGGRREKVILATKVFGDMGDENDIPAGEKGVSAHRIRRHFEASLKRLQTDHVELYQMHHIDERTGWDEIWEAYETLVRQGRIEYAGSSNFAGWHLVKAQKAAEKRNFMGLVSEQHKYSLLCRLPELEVLPAAQDLGIGIIPWSPLAGGLLGGNALDAKEGTRSAALKDEAEKHRKQLEDFKEICKATGSTESVVSIAWLLANPAVTAPIIGPRTIDQLNELAVAVDLELDENTMKRLDEIFPGPGGKAPQAYAW